MTSQDSAPEPKDQPVKDQQHHDYSKEKPDVPAREDQSPHAIDGIRHRVDLGQEPHPTGQGIERHESTGEKGQWEGCNPKNGKEIAVAMHNKGQDERNHGYPEAEQQADEQQSEDAANAGSDMNAKQKT